MIYFSLSHYPIYIYIYIYIYKKKKKKKKNTNEVTVANTPGHMYIEKKFSANISHNYLTKVKGKKQTKANPESCMRYDELKKSHTENIL